MIFLYIRKMRDLTNLNRLENLIVPDKSLY